MTDTDPFDSAAEKYMASQILMASAGHAADALDSFSTWLLGGSAAILAVLFASQPHFSDVLAIPTLQKASYIFLLSAAIGVLNKYLATIIAGAYASSKETVAIAKRLDEEGFALKMTKVHSELEKAIFPPMRWIVRKANESAEKGDTVMSARAISRIAQIQGYVTVVVSLLILVAFGVVVFGLMS